MAVELPPELMIRARASVDGWKTKLLDLTPANRLLRFRLTKLGSVPLSEPNLSGLFDLLVVKDRAVPVVSRHVPEGPAVEPEEDKIAEVAREPSLQHPRIRGAKIVGAYEPDHLANALYSLRQKSVSSIEERGVNILHIALGFIAWNDPLEKDLRWRAPIILAPVTLDRLTRDSYTLAALEEDLVLNPTLAYKLEQDFSLHLPEIPDDFDSQGFDAYLLALRDTANKLPGAEVEYEAYLGLFSFTRITMYQDLSRCAEALLKHPVAGALAGLPPSERLPSLDFTESPDLDKHMDPRCTFQVLDADSSQQETLLAARKGAHMVIQGPPGTGKSQTITNLIAEGLADGKKILFVSEKAAALEVVRRRLQECGLADACLDLHSHKIDKKKILNDLESTLHAASPPALPKPELVYESLLDVREQLNRYVRELHMPRFVSGLTAYQVHGQLARLNDAPNLTFSTDGVARLTTRDMEQRTVLLRTLVGHAGIIDGLASHPWRGLKSRPPSFAFRNEMEQHLRALLEVAQELDGRISALAAASRLAWPRSGPDLTDLLDFFGKYRLTALALPAQGLRQRLEQNYASGLRYLRPSYWKDLLLLRGHCRTAWAWSYAVVLGDARKLERVIKGLGPGESGLDEGASWEMLAALDGPLGRLREELDYLYIQYVDSGFNRKTLQEDLQALETWCSEHMKVLDHIDEYLQYARDYEQAVAVGLEPFLVAAMRDRMPAQRWPQAYQRAMCEAWLDKATEESPALADFSRSSHEAKIRRFRELDRELMTGARQLIASRLASARPRLNGFVQEYAASAEISILAREFRKKRRIKPLRKLLREAPRVIQALKPCFMMSPLSVSQFLDPEHFLFDIVIFDEASQVKVEDAVGCIFRGKQVVVAGDSQQLPPTRFFDALTTEDEWESVDGDALDSDAYESILDALSAMPAVLANKMLLWHYRSRHEALIAFSNKNFYNRSLYTFPDPEQTGGAVRSAMEFIYVQDGIYERGSSRRNPVEARKVVELVLQHARERSHWSLAVITFSEAQREAIAQELDKALESYPDLRPFFEDTGSAPFRIKNLELIQGDERDAIIFSTGYGPDSPGKPPHMNFGPLNKEGGRRRLNVAVTRARHHVTVVSSMLPEELARSDNEGVKLLREYMALSRDGLSALADGPVVGDFGEVESPFETSVYAALSAKGLSLHPQVGCSGYRIDLAVVDPKDPGRYCLGIECDGATYHSARTARDRDRLRQQVLENLGWNIYRIWSRDWIANPAREIKLVLDAVALYVGGNGPDRPAEPEKAQERKTRDEDAGVANQVPREIVGGATGSQTPGNRDLPEGVAHYELYTISLNGSAAGDVKTVVDTFGPLHVETVLRHVTLCWGYARKGKNIRRAIEAGIRVAVGQNLVKATPDRRFLWPVNAEEIRPRVPYRDEEPRDMDEVCPEEIVAALRICLDQAGGGISKADLTGLVIRLFGHQRATEKIARPVETVLESVLAKGGFACTDGTIHAA